jgi:glycosyltransferase involved in cell wall biosynthesis
MAEDLFATVIIRSFHRMDELRALTHRVLAQDYANFEVLVVDSSKGLTARSVHEQLATSDPRVRVVHTPARGCPAAANDGVKHARGEVVAFIDDDDFPLDDAWLSRHMRHYRDPDCLGVNGFMVYEPEHRAGPALIPALRQWRMLSHGFFKQPRCYAYSETPKRGIDYLMGGNASIRKSAVQLGGGWDEGLQYHNEHSLFLRLAKRKKPSEYLMYDPEAKMQIRKDVAGGLDYRFSAEVRTRVDQLAKYFVWVVGREYPMRIYGALPVFVPSFVLFSAIAGYELAAGRPVNRWVELMKAAVYAPASLLTHVLNASEHPRVADWLAETAHMEPLDSAGSVFTEGLA